VEGRLQRPRAEEVAHSRPELQVLVGLAALLHDAAQSAYFGVHLVLVGPSKIKCQGKEESRKISESCPTFCSPIKHNLLM
jgi:hypothetical protein